MNLVSEWASWTPAAPPHVLPADRSILMADRSAQATVLRQSWPEAFQADDFCAPGDTRIHLGLLPQPFFGDLEHASVFLLLLNPGLGPTDYYGEHIVQGFRETLLSSIRQDFSHITLPFLFLDPQFAWHGGFDWWHSKLARLIQELATTWGVPYSDARAGLARSLASIELFPYHSSSFRDSAGWLKRLPSVQLARGYVRDVLMPRVRRKQAIVVVTRQAHAWGLPPEEGVVVYGPAQARAAHLTPDSPGGRAILAHLARMRPV